MNWNSHIERLTGLNNMTADAQTTNGAMLSAIMVLAMIYWRCLDKKILHNRHHMYTPAMGSCLKLFKCLDGICDVRSQFTIGEDIWSHQEASYTDYIDHMDVLGFGCPHITVIFCWKWWMVIFVFLNYRLAKVSPNKLLSYQYMHSRRKDKKVSWPYYLYNGNPYIRGNGLFRHGVHDNLLYVNAFQNIR